MKGIEAVRPCMATKWSTSVEATLMWIEVVRTGKEAVRTTLEATEIGAEAMIGLRPMIGPVTVIDLVAVIGLEAERSSTEAMEVVT